MESIFKSYDDEIVKLQTAVLSLEIRLEVQNDINQKIANLIYKFLAEHDEDENVTR